MDKIAAALKLHCRPSVYDQHRWARKRKPPSTKQLPGRAVHKEHDMVKETKEQEKITAIIALLNAVSDLDGVEMEYRFPKEITLHRAAFRVSDLFLGESKKGK